MCYEYYPEKYGLEDNAKKEISEAAHALSKKVTYFQEVFIYRICD